MLIRHALLVQKEAMLLRLALLNAYLALRTQNLISKEPRRVLLVLKVHILMQEVWSAPLALHVLPMTILPLTLLASKASETWFTPLMSQLLVIRRGLLFPRILMESLVPLAMLDSTDLQALPHV